MAGAVAPALRDACVAITTVVISFPTSAYVSVNNDSYRTTI
jgi:hypothetical protein